MPGLPAQPLVCTVQGKAGGREAWLGYILCGLTRLISSTLQLGHNAYMPGTTAHSKIIEEFGEGEWEEFPMHDCYYILQLARVCSEQYAKT